MNLTELLAKHVATRKGNQGMKGSICSMNLTEFLVKDVATCKGNQGIKGSHKINVNRSF